MRVKFSIIIPVRKVNAFLRENISNLKKLDYEDFEVIIVLDENEDYGFNDDRFKIVATGPKGPGEKRNIGVSKSSGDIVVFLDDDAYPHTKWLNRAKEIFEDESVFALGGPALTPKDAPFLEKMSGRIHESFLTSGPFTYRHIPKEKRLIDDYPTVNLFVRKSAFESVGGFITEFWPGEDTKLCLDLVKKFDRKFLYSPKPIVYHHRRDVFLPHLKQLSRYGRHRGQFARIFPETSFRLSYFIPVIFVLGLLFGPLVSLFYPVFWWVYGASLSVYTFLILWESLKVAFKEKSIKAFLYVLFGIFLTHIVYGVSMIIGLLNKPKLELREIDSKTGNYLGG